MPLLAAPMLWYWFTCGVIAADSSAQHVGALFPGLGELRRTQESKLRELLAVAPELRRTPPTPSARFAPAHIDESREPITNSPPAPDWPHTRRPPAAETAENAREPELLDGPDDELFTHEQRQQAQRAAAHMCAQYSAAETRRVSAIPLVPTPAPVSVAVPTCAPSGAPLVVGGAPVSVRDHPHMAALGWPHVRERGYAWKCGGALVGARHVLTAAHCSYQDRDTSVLPGPPRVVQLGSSTLGDPHATLARVARVLRHPRYRAPAAYFDIALLELAADVTFSERVRPACVGEPPPPGESMIATGWGRTEYGGHMSEQLRGVALPVRELSECARALGTSRRLPHGPDPEVQLCAGDPRGGKDTCQGDSGGPAVTRQGCVWRVVGVTSLGRACGAPDLPALYARALPAFVAAVVRPEALRL